MGRLWKTACFILEGSEIRATRFPTGCAGAWKTLILIESSGSTKCLSKPMSIR